VVAARERDIIVDLTGLEFIDSSGLAALARVREQARHAGGDLLLAAPQQQVLRLLTLTRLTDVFSIHASVDEAASDADRLRRAAVTGSGSPAMLAVAELGRGHARPDLADGAGAGALRRGQAPRK